MKFGYTRGSQQWVRFYGHLNQLLGGQHTVQETTQCDVFFCTYSNAADASRCLPGTRVIFLSGECWDTEAYEYDGLIDCKPPRASRIPSLYYPFYALSFFERSRTVTPSDLLKPVTYSATQWLATKTRFCAYMYRYDVDFRVQLLDDIQQYRAVDILGQSRHPHPRPTTDRTQSNYLDQAVAKYRPYKFVICCENRRHPGYITEKIINAMLANALPIYLGAPDVASHFNPRSFINVGAFGSRREAIEFIRQVDQDDALYCAMLQEPWFLGNTLPQYVDSSYLARGLGRMLRQPLRSRLGAGPRPPPPPRPGPSRSLRPPPRRLRRVLLPTTNGPSAASPSAPGPSVQQPVGSSASPCESLPPPLPSPPPPPPPPPPPIPTLTPCSDTCPTSTPPPPPVSEAPHSPPPIILGSSATVGGRMPITLVGRSQRRRVREFRWQETVGRKFSWTL